jgi:hypothetical protein
MFAGQDFSDLGYPFSLIGGRSEFLGGSHETRETYAILGTSG